MKIYSETVCGNERANLVGLGYIVTAIERVENATQWLTTTDEICQHALAEMDMLILLGEKFPHDMNIKLKKAKLKNGIKSLICG